MGSTTGTTTGPGAGDGSGAGPRVVLVHPPLGDPTMPYHATAYLAGSLRAAGFPAVRQRDANAEFVDWCLDRNVFGDLAAEAEDRMRRLGGLPALGLDEQEEYLQLWDRDRVGPDAVRLAVETMRTLDRFLDFGAYTRAVRTLRAALDLVGALSYPGRIEDFVLVGDERFAFTSLADLTDTALRGRICRPFLRFLDDVWAGDPEIDGAACLGIGITFQHQLFHALALAGWFRARHPDRRVLLGGTEISRIYASVRDKGSLRALFDLCDAFVVGEGETAIRRLAEAGFAPEPGAPIQNLVTYDRARDELHLPERIVYEDLRTMPPPHYDPPWELYLSPVRGLSYSPTRGCYWNRCVFCSYGLNEHGPSAPWRTRPVELAAAELAEVSREQGAGYVYLAVDTVSPGYLGRLADALLRHGTSFAWSAELRLERVFGPELCERLARSGCVSALFGLESGSQRVLDAMDKGTRVDAMRESMRHLAGAGIAVQLMTFSGFPTETPEDRAETRRFLEETSDAWANGGIGSFVLLDGSVIAREPERFGLRVAPVGDCDIPAVRGFERLTGPAGASDVASEVASDIASDIASDAASPFPRSLPRPWAGGGDTLHSLVYYHRHGRAFFREHPLPEDESWPVPGGDRARPGDPGSRALLLGESWFDLRRLAGNLRRWREDYLMSATDVQALTAATYRAATAGAPELRRDSAPHRYARVNGRLVEVPATVRTPSTGGTANGSGG